MTVETIGIVIGTFGSDEWFDRGNALAVSIIKQEMVPVVHKHSDTLSDARNASVDLLDTDWLVFLDADDSLASGYCQGILNGTGDLRQPMTVGVRDGKWEGEPNFIQPAPSFLTRNHLIIGTGVRREMFVRLGGFPELPVLEDWAFWLKCWADGAEMGTAPGAIYEVGLNDEGRNKPSPMHGQIYGMLQEQFQGLR